jgi:hypothetical protein
MSITRLSFLAVQVVVVGAFAATWATKAKALSREFRALKQNGSEYTRLPVSRNEPLQISSLYNRPDFITDDELADVLRQIQPRFPVKEMKPNFVEHALRTWGVHATFRDPEVRSGAQLAKFLTDTASFVDSWGPAMGPLLQERPTGISVRWGQEKGASVHHDHWLASLTEGGATLDTPVYGPSRNRSTLADVLHEALRDFRLDEKETEWTAMAFGMWIPPEGEWYGSDGRRYSFDLIARRLMRGQKELGVCSGTHRVFSLMVLVRLDDEFPAVLSDAVRGEAYRYLEEVRDAIVASQFEDGHWPSNWPDGADAVKNPVDEPLFKKVIATGHHLEWLSIAPRDLHPPDEQIRKAFRWVIDTTKAQTPAEILERYTFFSHVGAASARWRQRHPAEFWKEWEERHP